MSSFESDANSNPLGFLCPHCTQDGFCSQHKKIAKKHL